MEKLSIYELLSWMVPGTLLVWTVAICFPAIVSPALGVSVPEAFKVTALIALVVFVGNLVQAIASLIEPLLYKTWGGRPSDQSLRRGLGDRYLPVDTAMRIRSKLERIVGSEAVDSSLFLFAMQRAESANSNRVATFNALYAYHRALLVLTFAAFVCFLVAAFRGHFPTFSATQLFGIAVLLLCVNALLWYRTKQRAFYYAREILLTAERILDQSASKAP